MICWCKGVEYEGALQSDQYNLLRASTIEREGVNDICLMTDACCKGRGLKCHSDRVVLVLREDICGSEICPAFVFFGNSRFTSVNCDVEDRKASRGGRREEMPEFVSAAGEG